MRKPTRGAIAAGHPATAEAGAEMLRQGGNAFDAVVAAAFTSFFSELTLTSAAGGGFLTGYFGETEECILLDFFVDMPGRGHLGEVTPEGFFPVDVDFGATRQEFHVGPASAAVPGSLAGLLETHSLFGTLPLDAVTAPAIQYAREGIRVNRYQAFFFKILRPILTYSEEGRRIFMPTGRLLKEGDRLVLENFARTLEAFTAEGPALFYTGAVGDRLVQCLEGGGGLITEDDLRAYRVAKRPTLSFNYRGYTILTNPPPSSGGALIALCLELLQGVPMPSDAFQSQEALNALVAAMQITNTLREREYDQRLHETGFAAELLSPGRLSRYRQWHQALLSGEEPPAARDLAGGPSSTTHISAIDDQGNAASVTASNGEGSGIFIPGTGIMVNNMLGEEDLNPAGFHRHAPGTRISSMMSPTIVLKGKDPVAVLGSGGSNRIRSAITQTIMNLIDFGTDAREAVDAPRIHWERGMLNQEPGFQASVSPRLCPRENRILWKETNLFFGGVHVVTGDPRSRTFGGAGDHRRGGVAIVVE